MSYIEIKNVTCKSNDEYNILKDLDLEINRGQCILLMGSSGSGKTSITKLINGIVPHFEEKIFFQGDVLIDGKSTRNTFQYQISEKVGSIFQNPKSQFFNSDVEGEIAFGLENIGMTPDKIKEDLKMTINRLNLNRLRGKDILYLSSGEKQILAFASIFALNTDIVVLDEPSSNLDMDSIDKIKKNIELFKSEGKTIIVAEHRLYYLIDIIDKAYYIEDGIIKDCFEKEEFKLFSTEKENDLKIRTLSTPELKLTQNVYNNLNEFVCENLSFAINNENLFNNINISLNRGEILGIIGKNGTGKTSLLKCIAGLYKNGKGNVCLDSRLLNKKERLKRTYLVTQDINSQFFTESVIEECKLNLSDEKHELLNIVLKKLNLYKCKNKHPMSLSGGQKQRLAIALALISDKEILEFDEPTSGLDYNNMIIVSNMIREISKTNKKITIIVSHDYEFLNLVADSILTL